MNQPNQELIAENINLVYKFCSERGIYNDDDKQGMLLSVCEGVEKYDPKKSAFSTFVYMKCRNYLNSKYNRISYQKRNESNLKMISMDEEEYIQSEIPCGYDLETSVSMKLFLSSLNDFHRKLIKLRLQGYNNKDIAEMIGCSSQNITNVFKEIRKEGVKWMES